AVDWMKAGPSQGWKVGVAGYGEGGLVALYAAATDPRIDAALVSGYFGPRERVWAEPIYRNVWGLLREVGDAELATLVAPRPRARVRGRARRGPPPGGAAARPEGAARGGRGGRTRHAGTGGRPARMEAARSPPAGGLPGACPGPRGRRGGGRLSRPRGRARARP